MTRRLVRLIVGGALAIGAAAFAAWFLDTHERVETDVFSGRTGEALSNPFLAAEHLLVELGIDADNLGGDAVREALPSTADTLVLGDAGHVDTAQETDALLGWAALGGHLIYVAPNDDTGLSSPLLAALGLVTVMTDSDTTDDEVPDDEAAAETDVTLCFHTASRLAPDEPARWDTLADDKGIAVATTVYGDGVVTVLAAADALTTDHIGYYDNADFVHKLVTDPGDPGTVWFVHRRGVTPLYKLIWRAAWPVIVGLALLVVAFLLARGNRFGPLVPTPPRMRRSLDEHVDACGRFLYRSDGTRALVGAVRDLIARRITRVPYAAAHLKPKQLATIIGRHTGRDAGTVAGLLDAPAANSHREFTEQIADLQTLWKSL